MIDLSNNIVPGRSKYVTAIRWVANSMRSFWMLKDFEELAASKEKQKAFCEYGSDLYGMLKGGMAVETTLGTSD